MAFYGGGQVFYSEGTIYYNLKMFVVFVMGTSCGLM